ncbi:deoxyribose-phosphate aldolase [Natranaerovirga pectinivora]|uniref:Deoxyribose-phosphate aldolase n=1 Tax=Natranaerovirga pectinivora TaxID=682400 RepID=A0A4R3MJP5_9FIRM|nr:deoxyribose-phosphate aldolase [Natranaerovirga pectinivora]TCT14276.1 deoxyribose-phosphate aldolase [Natranaerovirga pectinivora]
MNLANYIDHTILKADTTKEEVIQICKEAIEYEFASVCVNLYYTKLVNELLKNTEVKTTTVIGFPLGAVTTEVKVFETEKAVEYGADEIDMVMNIGALKNKNYEEVLNDIKEVKKACNNKAILKVIIETALLTGEEKEMACKLSLEAGADFVKTSTGFSTGGATVEDIQLMKNIVKDQAKVKASGGIRDKETTIAMINAGADRIGASASVHIVTGEHSIGSGY